MPELDQRLKDILEPARSHAVGALLEALAQAISSGAEVVPEPLRREAEGAVGRYGPLELPERGDLAVTRAGRRLVQRVEAGVAQTHEPVTLVAEGGFTAVIAPFAWEAADLVVEARQRSPDWGPLRRWFLEWVQPRMTDLGPDLAGAAHALQGPFPDPHGNRFELDLGSAPAAAVAGLIAAVAESGALRLRIGQAV